MRGWVRARGEGEKGRRMMRERERGEVVTGAEGLEGRRKQEAKR